VKAVIVDNASGDGSVGQIAEAITGERWSDWASVHEAPRNGGFAYGNNRGWERSTDAEYVLLLNSDTIVAPGCLQHCLSVMERDRLIGAMSCLVLNRDGSVQNVCRRFPNPLNQFLSAIGLPYRWPRFFGWANTEELNWDRRTVARDVDWIGGAFMLLRGDLIRRIGLLDEDFFFYGEDVELCHRIWKAGLRVYYDPGASITHLGGGSSDPSRLAAAQRSLHRWQARYLVQRKCYGAWAAWLVRLIDITAYSLRRLRLALSGQRRSERYRLVCDVLRLLTRPLAS
jgi:GT2 family glycosyltransferase